MHHRRPGSTWSTWVWRWMLAALLVCVVTWQCLGWTVGPQQQTCWDSLVTSPMEENEKTMMVAAADDDEEENNEDDLVVDPVEQQQQQDDEEQDDEQQTLRTVAVETIPSKSPTTSKPTRFPTTSKPTRFPTTSKPTRSPTTLQPTDFPTTSQPTAVPTTSQPTSPPTTTRPTRKPLTISPYRPRLCLLLTSFGTVVEYDILLNQSQIIHTSSTHVFYSIVAHTTTNEFLVSRRDLDSKSHNDSVDEISLNSPEIIQRTTQLPSVFTHEVVRRNDQVFVADTSSGAIHILPYPALTPVTKSLKSFTPAQHINTISLLHPYLVWVILHNKGEPSSAAQIDPVTGKIHVTIQGIGMQNHGWLAWAGGFLTLSSQAGQLVHVIIGKEPVVLWTSPERNRFLKGLTVVDDIAYFGMSEMRSREDRAKVRTSLVAFDLIAHRILWIRQELGTIGLVNTISLRGSDDSTYRAQCSSLAGWKSKRLVDLAVEEKWAFGSLKDAGFIKLPIKLNARDLQRELAILVKKHTWTYRADVNNYFILLVTNRGEVNDQSNIGPFAQVQDRIDSSPYLKRVMAAFKIVVGRSRFMMLKPGESVAIHQDRTYHFRYKGTRQPVPDAETGYWGRRFRIHVPIVTHPSVLFTSGKMKIHMEEGHAYVFDNAYPHTVENPSNISRVHLVIDTVGTPAFFDLMRRGEFFPAELAVKNNDVLLMEKQGEEQEVDGTISMNGHPNIVYETWVDSPVFSPIPVAQVQSYLQRLETMIYDTDLKQQANIIFDAFFKIWERRQSRTLPWEELVSRIACNDELAQIKLRESSDMKSETASSSGITLLDAVEAFSRQLIFPCSGPLPSSSNYRGMEFGEDEGPLCFVARRKRDMDVM